LSWERLARVEAASNAIATSSCVLGGEVWDTVADPIC
jgi:hypothetical protein